MIKKETHPEIFKKRTEAFNNAYANDPNHGFKEGYIPPEQELAEHGIIPSKNKIVEEYEKKIWYRIVKSLYFFVFGLSLIILNFNVFFETPKDKMLQSFIIGNLIIIFTMGTIEGLFWYISCGEWGYPKDEEPINLK